MQKAISRTSILSALTVIVVLALVSSQAFAPVSGAPTKPVTYTSNPHSSTATALAGVFGDDDRTLVTDTTQYPYSAVTQVLIERSGQVEICSGAMVSSYHVITSAHCLYENGVLYDSVTVYPGRNGTETPYGSAGVTNVRMYDQWLNNEDISYDLALLTLDRNVGKETGWFEFQTLPADDPLYFGALENAGYPTDKQVGDITGGYSMFEVAGTGERVDNVYPATHWFNMDGQTGQSGSPVWYTNEFGEPIMLSVWGYGSESLNFAIRFDQERYDDVNGWIASDTPPETYAQVVDTGARDFSVTPETLNPGASYTFTSGVESVGTADAQDYTVEYYLSADQTLSSDDTSVTQETGGVLPVGSTATVTASGTLPFVEAGDYYVIRAVTTGSSDAEVTASQSTVTVVANSQVTVDITSPVEGETITESRTVTITGSAVSDNSTVTGGEVSFDDGATFDTATYSEVDSSWSYTYEAPDDGTYTVLVRAIDGFGVSGEATRSFSLDAGPTLFAGVDVFETVTDPEVPIGGFTEDPDGIASVTASVNGGTPTPLTVSDTGGISGTVTLTQQGLNDVVITSTDTKGFSTSVDSVAQLDSEPPTIVITAPATTQSSSVEIEVTVTDEVSGFTFGDIQLNGEARASVSPGTNTYTIEGLQLGENTITVTATDNIGQTGSETVIVNYASDSEAPAVSLTTPATSTSTTVEVTGTATDDTGIEQAVLLVNGNEIPLTLGFGGSFAQPVTLTEGTNSIVLEATDVTGKTTATATQDVFVDSVAPSVSLDAPATATDSTVTVTGTATDANLDAATLTVNGVDVTITLDSVGAFSQQVSLAEGENTLVLTAADSLGNENSVTATVSVDTSAPTVVLTAPETATTTTPTISGAVSDANLDTATLTVNGVTSDVALDSNGEFTLSPTLVEGENTLVLTGADSYGQESSVTRTTFVDSIAPAVSLDAPSESTERSVTVTGSVSDSNLDSAVVVVNGVEQVLTLDTDGTFSEVVELADGENTVELVALDTLGNQNSVSTTVLVEIDETAPVVSLAAPTTSNTQTVTVTGSVTDATGVSNVELVVNGAFQKQLALASDGSFSETLTLDEGASTVEVQAVDVSGNTASATATVVVDSVAPTLTMDVPSTADVSEVTVTGAVNDVSDIASATLTVNGDATELTLASDGSFSTTVTLVEGENVLTLAATDAFDNSAQTEAAVVLETPNEPTDTVAPTIENVSSPDSRSDDITVVRPNSKVSLVVVASDDASGVESVVVDGVALTFDAQLGAWTGEVRAARDNGPQEFSITVTDAAGNVETATERYVAAGRSVNSGNNADNAERGTFNSGGNLLRAV